MQCSIKLSGFQLAVVMTGPKPPKLVLLVANQHDRSSLQVVGMYAPAASAEYESFGEVKGIPCFKMRISPHLFLICGWKYRDSLPLSSFSTRNDVKTPSVADVIAGRMFHQFRCQTGKQWQVAHISPARANGPVSGTRQRDKSDTYRGDSFSHLGIMVLIGVLLVSPLQTETETKKKCVIKCTISSWCKKTRGFRRPRHISNLPFTKKHDGSTQYARRVLCFDTSRIQLLDPKAPLVHTHTLFQCKRTFNFHAVAVFPSMSFSTYIKKNGNYNHTHIYISLFCMFYANWYYSYVTTSKARQC